MHTYEDATAGALLDSNLPPGTEIWRYLDLGKFLSLIEDQKIHFSRLDQFDDEYEGSPTAAEVRESVSQLPQNYKSHEKAHFINERKFIFASCWHENASENLAMWKLYGTQSSSVAIVSTAHRLARVLLDIAGQASFSIVTRITYIDHKKDSFARRGAADLVHRYVHKDVAYSFEKEVRAIFCHMEWPTYPTPLPNLPLGIAASADLDQMISRVVLPPACPSYIQRAIEKLVVERYRYRFPVERSRLDRRNVFPE